MPFRPSATKKVLARNEEVHKMVREEIASHAPGDNVLMSAKIMVGILEDKGLPPAMANSLLSQIRKGAPLHEEWKRAFAIGLYLQDIGRARSTKLPSVAVDAHWRNEMLLEAELSPREEQAVEFALFWHFNDQYDTMETAF
jgi:hypothetical protein